MVFDAGIDDFQMESDKEVFTSVGSVCLIFGGYVARSFSLAETFDVLIMYI